jgi:hypothetical protein
VLANTRLRLQVEPDVAAMIERLTDYLARIEMKFKTHVMGTVHKFKRPPKNEKQFKGYRPPMPKSQRRAKWRWQNLRLWHRSLLAWGLLIAIAACVVGARMLTAIM